MKTSCGAADAASHDVFSKKTENPLTFLTLLYIVYLLSFDGKSGVGTDAGGFRRGEVIL